VCAECVCRSRIISTTTLRGFYTLPTIVDGAHTVAQGSGSGRGQRGERASLPHRAVWAVLRPHDRAGPRAMREATIVDQLLVVGGTSALRSVVGGRTAAVSVTHGRMVVTLGVGLLDPVTIHIHS
jgi:hypothetical protein